MDPLIDFGTTLGAVLIGNALTFWCIWAGIKMTRHESEGKRPDEAPWLVLFGLMAAPAALALCGVAMSNWP